MVLRVTMSVKIRQLLMSTSRGQQNKDYIVKLFILTICLHFLLSPASSTVTPTNLNVSITTSINVLHVSNTYCPISHNCSTVTVSLSRSFLIQFIVISVARSDHRPPPSLPLTSCRDINKSKPE